MSIVYVELSGGLLRILSGWTPTALTLSAPLDASEITRASMKLFASIAMGAATRTDLRRRRIVPTKLFDAAIKNLLDGGVVRVHSVPTATKPKSVYVASETIPLRNQET